MTKITVPAKRLTDLPAGDLNHHWTKNIIASEAGTKLYATVGSNSNVAENGIEKEEGRAAIWEVDVSHGREKTSVRDRPAQSERHGVGAGHRRVVDRGE